VYCVKLLSASFQGGNKREVVQRVFDSVSINPAQIDDCEISSYRLFILHCDERKPYESCSGTDLAIDASKGEQGWRTSMRPFFRHFEGLAGGFERYRDLQQIMESSAYLTLTKHSSQQRLLS
jgi:hypothetical protein